MADKDEQRRTQDGYHLGNWEGHDFEAPKGAHRGGRDPQKGDEYDKDGNFKDPNAGEKAAKQAEMVEIKKKNAEDRLKPAKKKDKKEAKKPAKKKEPTLVTD